ncbi:hypothetical protein [Tuwongella immobilis]|uniref:hypothetical protein n=1 Tax=Tuwongella immobilis TaxID=692036 RepID=UPI0013A6B75B|nr:hypothetical protein [Tuwongella immobilis]
MPNGTIRFEPAGSESFSAESSIDAGKYSIEAIVGLGVGSYKVMISSGDPKQMVKPGDAPGMEGMQPAAKDIIPAKYNLKSMLTAEVKASGDNVFDFTLTK